MTYEEYKKTVKENLNGNMFARDSYTSSLVPMQKDGSGYKNYQDPRAFNPNLDTPQGLHELASKAGLGDDANRMLEQSGGESQKFFSGGFLMDAMDILNIGSYGMAGLFKGKGFVEGVKNRESFSDEDALGKYGLGGKVAGFALDIVLDPLTYVAPGKVLSKIPGMTKAADAVKDKLLGELRTIKIDGQELYQREGGWSPITMMANKLVYGFAVDRKFLDSYQKIVGKNEAMMGEADQLMGLFSKLDPELLKSTLSKDTTGRFTSTSLEELQRKYSPEQMQKVQEVYDTRDALMQRLVDLDVISKDTADEHWGTYLKQSYDEYVIAKETIPYKKGIGITHQSRVQELTPEKMKELGQVEDPSVIWGTTLIKQIDLVKKAELQKLTADNFSITTDQLAKFTTDGGKVENLFKVPDAPSYKLEGKEVALKTELGRLNTSIKSVLKERKVAFKDNKEVLGTIGKIEKEMDRLKTASASELGEGISGVRRMLREGGLYEGPLKKAPTSEGQKAIANELNKWFKRGSKTDRLTRETYSTKELMKDLFEYKDGVRYSKSPLGLAIMRAFDDPKMMYQWDGIEDFVHSVRYPDKAKVVANKVDELAEITDAQQLAKVKKAEEHARKYGDLEQQKEILKGTNLALINDVVNKIEDHYADLLFEKSNTLKALETNMHGQLAGKYVTKEVWEMMKGTFEPTKEVGESVVLAFKHMKVVWNPASHARNAVSATIQNWWRLGIGPWRVDKYIDAYKELKNNGPLVQEMKKLGFNERSGAIAELVENYLQKSVMGDQVQSQLGGSVREVKRWFKHADKVMVNSYGHMDNVAKVAAFKHGIEQGLSKEAALKAAYEATFNYSEVTPFVHQMRRAIWGVPFITFALKSAPLVASTLANNPGRISVFGKARNDLFKAAGVEGEQEAESLPDYMRDDMFVMRLPWKDAQGRSMMFDLSYIIPFGSMVNGDYLENPIGANPVLQLVKELSRNETFSGNRIFNETDDIETVISDVFIHVGKLYLPPNAVNELPDGYDKEGNREMKGYLGEFLGRNTQDKGPNERSLYQKMFKDIGASVSPYDLESRERQMAYKQKENLQQLLVENGVLNDFRNPYLPKDSELKPKSLSDHEAKPIGR